MAQNLPKQAVDALAFEEKILPNGLAIRLFPMPEYNSAHVIYATKFGSVDRDFEQNGKRTTLPAGVAHFLEHKMFENKDGVDAFTLYADTGASANAYTSFERTCYIFTAADGIDRNLDILLSFVSEPYFTEQTVAKEQGIIGEEINMYRDYSEVQCYYAVLECMYHNHPIKDEIVGSVQSISEITPEMLYACTDAFYNPSNMALCAAGNITMAQLEAAVERAGLPKEPAAPVTRHSCDEPQTVAKTYKELEMQVSMPVFCIGYKEKPAEDKNGKTEVICGLLAELICGESSRLYRKLYDSGLVQPGFCGEFGINDGCLYFVFSGESPDPEKVMQELEAEIEYQRENGIDEQRFEACRKMMYGEAVAGLEHVERAASLLNRSYFKGVTPAQELDVMASVTAEDLNAALGEMLSSQRRSLAVVKPAGE